MSDAIRHRIARSCLLLCTMMTVTLLAGCGTTSIAPPPPERVPHLQPASPKAASVVRTARVLIGYPYRWGGHTPEVGFDCSGLVWFVYRQNGIALPRVSWQQFHAGQPITRQNIQPGDLIFYDVSASRKSLHVGIVTDRGTFVHAPSSGKKVMESSLYSPYWRQHYLGTRRIL
ncbi:glycoside hydrolase [Pseudodesulfovibrio sp. JC047]|uniref:C40 family peptidase n=1 Tax=Pseudodesulfovibrio sp. JC047 TaxID=2683199 RepID=UPI0013D2CBAF|nr:C40 family peptidase [Pseudodesulfovibrio sp. JC047]NDV18617.1 glycoside hydrolase [Pseudodesulfovibrio sp. JC047]